MKSIKLISILSILLFLGSCSNPFQTLTKPSDSKNASGKINIISSKKNIENNETITWTINSPLPTTAQSWQTSSGQTPVWLANPASKNCIDNGGKLVIQKNPNGGEYGICFFEDNRQCEEWAFFRGDCEKGGRKVTGYENEAQVFCAITGGVVRMDRKPISCELPKDGGTCPVDDYFAKGWDCIIK
jgi:putative hemolysin